MNGFGAPNRSVRVEDFVQTLTSQLDRAQALLAVKARAGVPLTFALKDLAIDLKVFWEVDGSGNLMIRHAGPNEEGASTMQFSFTTITRSMAEENTMSLALEDDPRPLDEVGGGESIGDDDRVRLERAGVRTVGQLRRLSTGTDPKSLEGLIGIPVMRLRVALERAARPSVTSQEPVKRPGRRQDRLLRIRGVNLRGETASAPEVRLAGEPVEVLEATSSELLVRPLGHHTEGRLEVLVDDDLASGWFRLPEDAVETEGGDGDARRPREIAPPESVAPVTEEYAT